MYLSASGIVVTCDRSCICVLVESLWPVSGHLLCASRIVVGCERSCICLLVESLWPVNGHVFVY
jgi:hypothetical protein